ncbi:MAG: efflux RND transporter periplasmic adaptor subunit, partial [Acidobacteriota bacterium]|nr:efflux RND transporter periplasmic adaptor subunit [Acidobacteriota bacterium]
MPTIDEPVGGVPDRSEAAPTEAQKAHRSTPKHGHSPVYWLVFILLLAAAAVVIFFIGWLPRHKREEETNRQANDRRNTLPKVQVVRIRRASSESELLVPGTTQAYTEANIYARASGYLTKRLVDIGDRVHTGQLLAVIDAPDLDKQVAQARSNLRQSESNLAQLEAQLHLAALTWDRYKVLVAKGVFSRQEGDTQEANYRVAEANASTAQSTIQANRDNLERLVVLQGYERVTAPFDGVVTARNIDVGTLITAQGTGSASSSATSPGTTQSGAEGNNAGSSGNISSSTMPSTGGAQGGAMFTISETNRFR